MATNLSFLMNFVFRSRSIPCDVKLKVDKILNFAIHFDKLFYIIKSKFFSKEPPLDHILSSDIDKEIIFLFSSLFKKHYEEYSIEDTFLSEEIGKHALKNLTSKWSSIRKGIPIEIPFTIEANNIRLAQKYFSEFVDILTAKSKEYGDSARDFDSDNQIPVDPNSAAMVEICDQLLGSQRRVLEKNLGCALRNLRLTGVVKLHPVESTESNPSIFYHTDGDNSLVKIILYLEDNLDPYDGNFSTLPFLFHQNIIGAHSPFARCFMSSHFLRRHAASHDYANLFNECISHSKKFTEEICRSRALKRDYPIMKWNGILFSGSSLMHRGGHNIKSKRPVLQGYVHPF